MKHKKMLNLILLAIAIHRKSNKKTLIKEEENCINQNDQKHTHNL